jgi:hypothetical protein
MNMLGGMLRKAFGGKALGGKTLGGKTLGNSGIDRAELTRVKDLARATLALGEDVAVSVNEINCTDPSCPGTETVILLMVPGERTRALKVTKPVDEVREADIREAASA